MKKKLTSPNGMTATGMGPKIVRSALPFLVAGIILGIVNPGFCRITSAGNHLSAISGIILITAGALLWIVAVIQFFKAFPSGKLITRGAYRISRNPIYASYAVLILPGLALLCNNWWFLAAAASMYIALVALVGEEEKHLRRIFRHEYLNYCSRVGKVGILPLIIWK